MLSRRPPPPEPAPSGPKPFPAAEGAKMAMRAVARQAKLDASGPDRAVPVVMSRAQLEALTVRAIREGKALRGLINELLAAAADRESR